MILKKGSAMGTTIITSRKMIKDTNTLSYTILKQCPIICSSHKHQTTQPNYMWLTFIVGFCIHFDKYHMVLELNS
jgi:hypothetical protein